MASLAVVVTTPPHSNLTTTAINFIASALANNIHIVGVFFYQDGVLNASKELAIPSDEYQTTTQWLKLHKQYQLPLHVCVTAAEKRGLTDELTEHPNGSNLLSAFTLSGLGELVELTTLADKVVQL